MLTEAFSTSIKYMQIMNEDGQVDQALFPTDLDDTKILEMYKNMLFARNLDAKVLSLQRQGRAVTYAPLLGQEATQIGSAMAMAKEDIFVPNFRQHGVFLARGMPLDLIMLYWRGYEEGNMIPPAISGYPIIVPVATQLPHATGIAMAQKYLHKENVVVAYVGDGGTSEGDFYEALNFAGVWKAPVVVIIENNQWAISMPRHDQTAAKTLAQKAVAAGIDAIQVDGNDVIAVYKATKIAIQNAAQGPTVIECITYRMTMHTTADDPTKYRSDEETEQWKLKDPLLRVRKYLTNKKLIDEKFDDQQTAEQMKVIDAAVEKAEQFKPDPASMFKTVYSFLPQVLKDELDEAEAAKFWQA